jgi:hypothetical protein
MLSKTERWPGIVLPPGPDYISDTLPYHYLTIKKYSRKVLQKYSKSTPKVLQKYSKSTPKISQKN